MEMVLKNNKPGGNTWNFKIWYRIVKYLDSLPASSAGKSEKVRKIQNLPAFASSFAKATADKKATDGQAIRNRNGIETAGKSGFE